MTPIIEDAENPTDVSVETQDNTPNDTQPTQLIRQSPYPKRLMLPKVVGKP